MDIASKWIWANSRFAKGKDSDSKHGQAAHFTKSDEDREHDALDEKGERQIYVSQLKSLLGEQVMDSLEALPTDSLAMLLDSILEYVDGVQAQALLPGDAAMPALTASRWVNRNCRLSRPKK